MHPMHSKKPSTLKVCMGPECKGCSAAKCYAEGGEIGSIRDKMDRDHEEKKGRPGYSETVKSLEDNSKKKMGFAEGGEVGPTLGSVIGYPGAATSAPKPKMLSEGGELHSDDAPDMPMDDDGEIHDGLGQELMDAFESKDKKRLMECIEACVLSCMSKGENHD